MTLLTKSSRTFYTTLLITTLYNIVNAQPAHIKETFDLLNTASRTSNALHLYQYANTIGTSGNQILNFPQFKDDNNTIVDRTNYAAVLGDRFHAVFNGYITMYQTTGDKAYLHKFISQTYFVQQFRNDLQNGSNHPGWVNFSTGTIYEDGNILLPMAKFCFDMQYNPAYAGLATTPLPSYAQVYSADALGINSSYKWPGGPIT